MVDGASGAAVPGTAAPEATAPTTRPGGGGLLTIFVTTTFTVPMAAVALFGVLWGHWLSAVILPLPVGLAMWVTAVVLHDRGRAAVLVANATTYGALACLAWVLVTMDGAVPPPWPVLAVVAGVVAAAVAGLFSTRWYRAASAVTLLAVAAVAATTAAVGDGV